MQALPLEEEEAVGEDEEDGQQSGQDQQAPGTGPYCTLHGEGPQFSAGSGGHPEGCTPCTFYCFTRRGCNRGPECRFCHLAHQSKLQQRRETWKKQQREKRKAIRERVAMEAPPRAAMEAPPRSLPRSLPPSGGKGMAAAMAAVEDMNARIGVVDDGGQAARPRSAVPFSYCPDQVVLTIGQDTEHRPQLAAVPVQFRLASPLPRGLQLDASSGAIRGAPGAPMPQTTIMVEADLVGGGVARAMLEIEVVDFTRGGFVMGHMSEFEPGRFMLLLHIPESGEGNCADGPAAVPQTSLAAGPRAPQQQNGGGLGAARALFPSERGAAVTPRQLPGRRGSGQSAGGEGFAAGRRSGGGAASAAKGGGGQAPLPAPEWW